MNENFDDDPSDIPNLDQADEYNFLDNLDDLASNDPLRKGYLVKMAQEQAEEYQADLEKEVDSRRDALGRKCPCDMSEKELMDELVIAMRSIVDQVNEISPKMTAMMTTGPFAAMSKLFGKS